MLLITPVKRGPEYKRVSPIPLTAPFGHCVRDALGKSRDLRPDIPARAQQLSKLIASAKYTLLIKILFIRRSFKYCCY